MLFYSVSIAERMSAIMFLLSVSIRFLSLLPGAIDIESYNCIESRGENNVHHDLIKRVIHIG
jgi:hypothetical protein